MLCENEEFSLGLKKKISVVWRDSDGNGKSIKPGFYRADSEVDTLGARAKLLSLDLEMVADSGLVEITRDAIPEHYTPLCQIVGEPKGYTHYKLGRESQVAIDINGKKVIHLSCAIDFYRERQEIPLTPEEERAADDIPI